MQIRFPQPTSYEIPDNNFKVEIKSIDLKEEGNNKNNRINAINSNEENQDINPHDENKNIINVLNHDEYQFIELEKKILVEINKKQELIIKISNGLIILMSLLIIKEKE